METSGTALAWGQHYAMVRPEHFRVDYVINPYMDLSTQPDHTLATTQWQLLVARLEELGARVEMLEQPVHAPDMVYAMNLGLALTDGGACRVAMSHMRHPERRVEAETARGWFVDAGFAPTDIGRSGIGPFFEAGDAFPFAGSLVVGHGPRTDEDALKHLAAELEVAVLGVRIAHPGMYHLDLAFCPLDEQTALICPAAFDPSCAEALLGLVPDAVVLSEAEALTFCANSVVVGSTVVMPTCPDRVRTELEVRGFEVRLVEVSEFHKGGGSVRCLTNPLDITLGRDLRRVPGGRVLVSSGDRSSYRPRRNPASEAGGSDEPLASRRASRLG